MRKIIPIIILLLLLTANASAEDIYITNATSGGDTGADCANAHSAAWFNTAGNWGGGAGEIDPGDTVHLCGTIATELVVQASGTEGNPITIYFEPDAKLSKGAWNTKAITASKDYIIIDGGTNGIIENFDNGTAGSYTNQSAAWGIYGIPCNNCEIKNLTIQNLYVRTSTTDEAAVWNQVCGINMQGTEVLIHDNIIHDSAAAILYAYGNGNTNVKVYNNTMYHCSHNFVLASGGDVHGGDFYFYNNHVYDYSPWDHATCKYHSSGIHAYGTESGGLRPDIDNFYIYNNLFEQPGNCPSGHIYLEKDSVNNDRWTDSNGTAYIFNNIAIGSSILAYVGANHVLVNNTVIAGRLLTNTSNPTIKNNYVSGTGVQIADRLIDYWSATSVTPANIDYNIHAYAYGWNIFACPAGGEDNTWAEYMDNCPGSETHSYDHTAWGTGGDVAGINQSNGRPEVGSDAIDHGVDLSGLGITALTSDRDGVARTTWGIGAYEYQASGTTWTVTPSSGTGYSAYPSGAQTIDDGATTWVDITRTYGYSISASGCGGSLGAESGMVSRFTTDAITENCNVTVTATAHLATVSTGLNNVTLSTGLNNVTLGN